MQQAARVSDMTAFFWLGQAGRVRPDGENLHEPGEKLTEDYVTGRFG